MRLSERSLGDDEFLDGSYSGFLSPEPPDGLTLEDIKIGLPGE